MCIRDREIGLEVHHDRDQFLCVEEGAAMVTLGPDDEVIEKTIAPVSYTHLTLPTSDLV